MTTLDTLREAADAIARGDGRRVHDILLSVAEDAHGPDSGRLAATFVRALEARASGEEADPGNLYAGRAGPDVMLSAFRLLTERTPLIRCGHVVANTAIEEALSGAEEARLIDIGMGHGVQWRDLLARLAEHPSPPRLSLVGVDVPAPGPDPAAALQSTGNALCAEAERLGITLRFTALPGAIEDLDLRAYAARPGETLVINAALALHHVPDADGVRDPAHSRDEALVHVLAARPSLFTIVEPDAAHNAAALPARVAEAWRHYSMVFAILAESLPDDEASRIALEEGFFGREVLNVIGAEGPARVERHERIAAWCARLAGLGFEPRPLDALEPRIRARLALSEPFSLRKVASALALTWHDAPLLGVSAWGSRQRERANPSHRGWQT